MSDKERNGGKGDRNLTYAFSKLLVNFTWWLNRRTAQGTICLRVVFGLDNIEFYLLH